MVATISMETQSLYTGKINLEMKKSLCFEQKYTARMAYAIMRSNLFLQSSLSSYLLLFFFFKDHAFHEYARLTKTLLVVAISLDSAISTVSLWTLPYHRRLISSELLNEFS